MTDKQKAQFNAMRAALLTIGKEYQTPTQLRKAAHSQYGIDYEEVLEMSYENIQTTAKAAVSGIKAL